MRGILTHLLHTLGAFGVRSAEEGGHARGTIPGLGGNHAGHGHPIPRGLRKGALLADERFLAGCGFNGADKERDLNLAEKTNLQRFLQEEPSDAAASGASEVLEVSLEETSLETLREERREDPQRKQPLRQTATRSELADREREHRPRDENDADDGEKHGGVHVRDESDEDEAASKRRGLREPRSLDDVVRCHLTLEDGTRCLRKALKGTRHCRTHAGGLRTQQG